MVFRALVSPLLIWDAWDGTVTNWFLAGFVAAYLSDVFDGIITRRLGVSTSRLRSAHTWADIALYVAALASAWLVHRERLLALGSSYHPWNAKAWGITLAIATVALFGWNDTGWAMWLMVGAGVLSNLECIAMSLLLPRWTHGVPSIAHALRLRTAGAP